MILEMSQRLNIPRRMGLERIFSLKKEKEALEEIQLESLDHGPGILPFKLGPTRIISYYHTFLQDIDLNLIDWHISNLHTQLENLNNYLTIVIPC